LPPLPPFESTKTPETTSKTKGKRKRASASENDVVQKGKKRRSKDNESIDSSGKSSDSSSPAPGELMEATYVDAVETLMDRLCIWDSVSAMMEESDGISKNMMAYLKDILYA
jgi:hypothetical protein